jgi:hypothetical protein
LGREDRADVVVKRKEERDRAEYRRRRIVELDYY